MPAHLKDPRLLRGHGSRVPDAILVATPAPWRPIPPREDGQPWHPQAEAEWDAIWQSPMADQLLEADVPGLLMMAELAQLYWTRPSLALAAELRRWRACFVWKERR